MDNIEARFKALKVYNFEHRSFVPYYQLQATFTAEKISELLLQNDVAFHSVHEIQVRVSSGGLKLFAILTAIGDPGSITRFIQADQYIHDPLDSKLPLKEEDLPRYFSNPDKGKSFLYKQWKFLIPVFSDHHACRHLDDRTILPFLERKIIGRGGFSEVYKVRIDRSHHNLSSPQTEVSDMLNRTRRRG